MEDEKTTEIKEEEKKEPPKGRKRTIGIILGIIFTRSNRLFCARCFSISVY